MLLLANVLREALEQRGAGALGLRLLLFRVDGAVAQLPIGLSRPTRASGRIAKLFHERIASLGEGLDAGYGFDMVRLSVVSQRAAAGAAETIMARTAAMPTPISLCSSTGSAIASAAIPLSGRFPSQATCRSGPSLLRPLPKLRQILEAHECPPVPVERPLRLLRQPEPVEVMAEVPEGPPLNFRWRSAHYRIARTEGPERIGSEWWLESLSLERKKDEKDEVYERRRKQAAVEKTAHLTRDYFCVEDAEGRRYWLYRQGLYGMSKEPPRWFMHGLFA